MSNCYTKMNLKPAILIDEGIRKYDVGIIRLNRSAWNKFQFPKIM